MSNSQPIVQAEFCTTPISSYTQVTGAPNSGFPPNANYPQGQPGIGAYVQGGYVQSVNITSYGPGQGSTPPTLIKDGWNSNAKVIAVIPGNAGIGNIPVNAPFECALRIEPAPGATLIVNYSLKPFAS